MDKVEDKTMTKEAVVFLLGGKAQVVHVSARNGLEVKNGHLICRDSKGWVVAAFPPGTWIRVVPGKEGVEGG